MWVIRTLDGDVHYRSEANTIDEACDGMAQSVGYISYADMCADMNYTGSNFEVTQIVDGRSGPFKDSVKGSLKDMAASTLAAFKQLRRASK